MPFPLLVAAGAALSVYSTYQANQAQARSELDNAKFYEMQAQYARDAMSREAQLARRKYSAAIGAQTGAFAKSGIMLGKGSSLGVVANTLANQMQELEAIRTKGEMEAALAMGRATQARRVSETLGSPLYNIGQAAGTALTAYAAGKS